MVSAMAHSTKGSIAALTLALTLAPNSRRDRYRESPYDTLLFVLQNPSGAKRWNCKETVDKETLTDALLVAFAAARPTEAAMARRLKEGRGFGDADGGGGVYHGKKKNKNTHK